MAEYVDREWLRKWAKEVCGGWDDQAEVEGSVVLKMPEQAPTVDAVEVVRCKDCENRRKSADLTDSVLCAWHGFSMPKDGFCSYGERSGDNA